MGPVIRIAALPLVAAAALALAATQDARQAILFLLGIGLGATLWASAFSFAGAWREAIRNRRTVGLRAQFLLVGLTACLFLPSIAAGEVWGQAVRGLVFPVGVPLVVGATLFGFGMQLGGGCGSGTLYAAGAGATRSWITLLAMVAGATLAAATADAWAAWPSHPPYPLADRLGSGPTLLGSLAALLGLGALLALVEARRHGVVQRLRSHAAAGRWPLWLGVLGLVALGFLTLLAAGRPWVITAAFPLWGSKLIGWTGWDDPVFWTFWDDPTRTEALLRPLVTDRTTLMDLGLLAGAFVAAALARRPAEPWRAPWLGPALAALLGGGMMGFGAVLASGCNISAFLAGIASGSLHGWVWFACAIAGSALALPTRRWFRLDPPGE